MKTTALSSLILGIVMFGHAAVQVVAPNGLANIEGNSSTADLWENGTGHQLMQVYAASEFAFLGANAGRIEGLAFRLESGSPRTFGAGSMSVLMYTTLNSPDSLNPNYSANYTGNDSVQVFGGSFGFASLTNGASPTDFNFQINFTTPFFYNPSRGNLVVHLLTFGTFGTQGPLLFDAQLASGDGVGRVFDSEGGRTGTADTLGLVTRFDITPVPEPSSLALAILAGLAAVLGLRLRTGRMPPNTKRCIGPERAAGA